MSTDAASTREPALAGELPASTSYEVRAALEELLERDLLGPRDGECEELPPGVPPAERYLVGRLVPRTRPSEPPTNAKAQDSDDPDLVDREVTGASEVQGDDIETGKVTRTGTMAASALGLSFRVPLDVERVAVTAAWGRYAPAKSAVQVTEQGTARTVWTRSPGGGTIELILLATDGLPMVVDHQQERVVLRATVRERAGVRVVDLELSEPPVTHDGERLHLALGAGLRTTRRGRLPPAARAESARLDEGGGRSPPHPRVAGRVRPVVGQPGPTRGHDLPGGPLPAAAHVEPPADSTGRARLRLRLVQHSRTALRRHSDRTGHRHPAVHGRQRQRGHARRSRRPRRTRTPQAPPDQAFADARRCSSDPLCAEHVPIDPSETLHAAACHACLFASETSCESNNRWLDRAVVLDLTGDGLAFSP